MSRNGEPPRSSVGGTTPGGGEVGGNLRKLRAEAEELVADFGKTVRRFGNAAHPPPAAEFDAARNYGDLLGRYVEMIWRLSAETVAVELPASPAPAAATGAASVAASAAAPTAAPAPVAVAPAPAPAPAPASASAPPARPEPPPSRVRHAPPPEPERVLRDPMAVVHDLQDVERDLEKLLARHEGDLAPDARLLCLKSLACRQRGLFDELQMQRFDDTRARDLYGALKDAIEKTVPKTSEPHPFQYVIPLDTRVSPRIPMDWYEAGRRYADLVECLPALDWVLSTIGFLSDADKKEVLEPIAARQQRLYRFLQQNFHAGGQDSLSDPQQGALFGRLREYARTNSIFLVGLNGQTEEAELERLAGSLPAALERQKTRVKRRREQEEAIAKVLTTVSGKSFGARPEHAEMLKVMVRRALDAGVLPSNPTLRDGLLEWGHLLGTDEKFAALVRGIDLEKRRRRAQQELADAQSRETVLDPQRTVELEKVLPLVEGTRAVMIGGLCREDNRKAVIETLKLTDLVWPDTTGRESVYDFEPLIAEPTTKVVFLLIRFMRTGYGRVAELCRKHDKTLVRLPAGYGVNQVIHQLAEQMGGDTPAPAPAPSARPASGTPASGPTASAEPAGTANGAAHKPDAEPAKAEAGAA